jgi:hypothetical protein
MDGWNVVLLVVAGFVAVMALVRLMLARQRELMTQMEREAADEQRRQKKSAAAAGNDAAA